MTPQAPSTGMTTARTADDGAGAHAVEAHGSAAKAAAAAAARAFRELTRPIRGHTAVGTVLAIVGSLAGLVPYVAIGDLARQLLSPSGPDAGAMWTTVAVIVGGLLVRAIAMTLAIGATHLGDASLQTDIARRMVHHLARVPLGWFGERSSGSVRKAMQNDVHAVHYLIAHARVETTAAIVLPLAGLGYLVWLDWRLALLAIATLPLYLAALICMMRGMGEQMTKVDLALTRVSSALSEFVSGISVVKMYRREGRRAPQSYVDAAKTFTSFYSDWVRPMVRIEALATLALTPPVVLLVNLFGILWFVSLGWVDPVSGVTGAMIALIIPGVLMSISFGATARREAVSAAGRITTLLETPIVTEAARPVEPSGGGVELRAARFGYTPERTVIDGIDLVCEPGTVTAIVGPSGAGKSTLVELVARFWDVDSGQVLIGGVDVRDIATERLYRHVAFVLQDVALVHGSVRDNIRLGRPGASDAEVIEAARAASIHDRILDLDGGYDAVVGDDARFSGGEAQRVAIARAILHDAPVLLLDEATAFADPENEAAIQLAVSRLIAGRTVLVVAHRLQTVVSADRIVVVRDGSIVEEGTHTELLAIRGEYGAMWELQNDDRRSA